MSYLTRRTLAWFLIAAAMFALAIKFTMDITWVHGGVLERGHAQPKPEQKQYLGAYVPSDSSDDLKAFYVLYSENISKKIANAAFSVPGEDVAVLLVNNLEDGENACAPMLAGGPPERPEPLDIQPVDWVRDIEGLHAIYIPAGPSRIIECRLKAQSTRASYTTRNLWIEYPRQAVFENIRSDTTDPGRLAFIEAMNAFQMRAVEGLKLDLSNTEGAEEMRFSGSYEIGDETAGGTWRSLMDGEFMVVTWNDIYRQQLRDIMLIVIGTLIGIGVTVMIEGLRPLVDSLDGPLFRRKPATSPEAEKPEPPRPPQPPANSP